MVTIPSIRPLVLGTHSGTFHCDEVLALVMLSSLVPDSTILRSRDTNTLSKAHILVDVGGVFDVESLRFDHHQKGFQEHFSDKYKDITKLSSAGLVYKYFGRELLEKCYNVNPSQVDVVYQKLYHSFVLSVDAIDNGVDVADAIRYPITTDLGCRVRRQNPSWRDTNFDEDALFKKAMELVKEELNQQIHGVVHEWLSAKTIVQKSVESRTDFHPSGKIVRLHQFCPWIDHLFDIEGEQNLIDQISFVIFQDQSAQYRLRAVPASRGSFQSRIAILPRLQGLRDEKLVEESGIHDLVFVHATGFIAGGKTEESVIKLAELCLEVTTQDEK